MAGPQIPEVHITDKYERHGCVFVVGKVWKGTGQWLTAKATIHKADIVHMSPTQFDAFILRRLPEFTVEDQDWERMAYEAAEQR